jgi:outer membrane receptor protein involved in Fe transport
MFTTVTLAFVQLLGAPVTAPAGVTQAAAVAVTAPAAVSAPVLAPITDFGQVDIEMALVSDFNELDLARLLDATVETGSKKKENISKAPAIIEVLTRKQLYDLGARDLYHALTYLPGIELIESFSSEKTLIFRGMPQEAMSVRTLLLINGHPTFEPITSSYPLELIPLESIERIEVLRGPGSVLYGNNAFAGVINVITVRRGDAGVTSLGRLGGGSFGTAAAGAANYGRSGELAWTVAGAGQRGDGYPVSYARDQLEGCAGHGLPSPDPAICVPPSVSDRLYNDHAEAFAELSAYGFQGQFGLLQQTKENFGMAATPRNGGEQKLGHSYGGLSYARQFGDVALTARGGYSRDSRTLEVGHFPLPTFGETHSDQLSYTYRGEAGATWDVAPPLTLDAGLSYDRYAIDHYVFLLDATGAKSQISPDFSRGGQDIASGYAQLTWRPLDGLSLLAGVRASRFQTMATRVKQLGDEGVSFYSVTEDPLTFQSPRGAVIYALGERTSLKFLYGEAFRLPNLWETNAALSRFIYPLPHQKPEIIRTGELGVDSRPLEYVSLRGTAFLSQVHDLIARRAVATLADAALVGDTLPSQAGLTTNFFDFTVYGFELSTQAFFSEQWSAFANATVKREELTVILPGAAEAGGPYKRPHMAPGLANAGVSWTPAGWLALRPNVQYVGPRGGVRHATTLNAVADWKPYEAVTVSLIGNNLTGEALAYPEIIRRYTASIPAGPGRSFQGRVTAEF